VHVIRKIIKDAVDTDISHITPAAK